MQLITHFLLVSSSLFINSQIPARPTNTVLDLEEAPEMRKRKALIMLELLCVLMKVLLVQEGF